uniref:Uncharacterized protein n=1 Tax=Rhizophora mucronata TaxID=61149 RepID=A0A2P2JQM1_RHIMU
MTLYSFSLLQIQYKGVIWDMKERKKERCIIV